MAETSSVQFTHIIRLEAWIGSNKATVPRNKALEAVSPCRPAEELHIDLTGDVPRKEPQACYRESEQRISREVQGFTSRLTHHEIQHVDVFGFAPIPLLMVLGRELGDKIPATLHPHHRDTHDWRWKSGKPRPLRVSVLEPPGGGRARDVAVLLSVSGDVHRSSTLAALDTHEVDVYELRVPEPQLDLVQYEPQVKEFGEAYRKLLAKIRRAHGPECRLHLFPALPLPLAIECGRRLVQADPPIAVYDWVRAAGQFIYALNLIGPAEIDKGHPLNNERGDEAMYGVLDGPQLKSIKSRLRQLIKEPTVIRDIVRAAGIDETRISWNDPVQTIWSNLLEEANTEPPKLRRLLTELVEYRSEQPELVKVLHDVIRLQEPPVPGKPGEIAVIRDSRELTRPVGKDTLTTVLVFGATPEELEPLRVNKELNEIQRLRHQGEQRDRFQVKVLPATTLFDLQDNLLRHPAPLVVHLAMHGLGADGQALEDEAGGIHLIDAELLEDLFRLHRDRVECVLLNACESLELARAVRKYIHTVISMAQPIGDPAALAFAKGFYQALFHGATYRVAFENGRVAIRGVAAEEAQTPVLLESDDSAQGG